MAYGEFARIYDTLIYEDINYDEMSEFILKKAESFGLAKESYLDLACGTGSVSIRVGPNFREIFAVDLSEDMLREAGDKFREKRIKGKLVCQDITELDLNRRFDLITCVLDSTNYILEEEDIKAYFKGVYNHLKDEGIFIFDINSYYKLSEILGNNVFIYEEDNVYYSWENSFEDEITSMFLTFFIKEGDLYKRFSEEHLERAYTCKNIEKLLDESGLELLEKFSGYSDEEVTDLSERIVFIVRKKLEG